VVEALILVTLTAVLRVHRYLTVIDSTRLFSADLVNLLRSFLIPSKIITKKDREEVLGHLCIP
jgi:hypothetical protein